jgi:hypothetical protein
VSNCLTFGYNTLHLSLIIKYIESYIREREREREREGERERER